MGHTPQNGLFQAGDSEEKENIYLPTLIILVILGNNYSTMDYNISTQPDIIYKVCNCSPMMMN